MVLDKGGFRAYRVDVGWGLNFLSIVRSRLVFGSMSAPKEAFMITKNQIKGLILEALKNVKESESVYKSLAVNDDTVLLGEGSFLDSIAFTHFVVGFEEKMEDATGQDYVFELDRLYDFKSSLTAAHLADKVASQWTSPKI